MAIFEKRLTKVTTNLYKGGANPASNTFLTLNNGVPTNGSMHCGAIGTAEPTPGYETVEKDCENQTAILGASISKHTLELKITLKEWTTEGLAWLTNSRQVGNGFFGGSLTELVYTPVTIVWTIDEDNGLYAFFHAYKTYVSSPAPITANKSDMTQFEATLTAVTDTTRDKTDPLYQYWGPDGYVNMLSM